MSAELPDVHERPLSQTQALRGRKPHSSAVSEGGGTVYFGGEPVDIEEFIHANNRQLWESEQAYTADIAVMFAKHHDEMAILWGQSLAGITERGSRL